MEEKKCEDSMSLKEEKKSEDDQFHELYVKLPKKRLKSRLFAQYRGFWFEEQVLRGILAFRQHFEAQDSDIVVATMPKAGTTWLKALTFAIANRHKFPISESPLLSKNPHQLVLFLELNLYEKGKIPDPNSLNVAGGQRRIFGTHLAYQCLPDTVLDTSDCRILYLCRNPLDVFTSYVHFFYQNGAFPDLAEKSWEENFDAFCEGTNQYGPFWDHIKGYKEASLKNPNKVLFLHYEELKKDTKSCVKKMAEFLGCPFSPQEEDERVVEGIIKLCSLENLKNLECNKHGEIGMYNVKFSSLFRKGEVGDWANFLTPSMAERLESLMKEKFGESGFNLNIDP
ncbi:OLC1v1024704C1 [Oldenlandia corymbosa var. corymbosa]|uniref:Sulfotransferase n=1 Tax=Oldenlandia corymbosa var. corymbosa TaxID=529605 RepID=A0AAV1C3W1_OLDCO|nr:OLC1v1024704C1 [Oldenlandia corymbosa var. corymbosa]